MRDPTAVRQPGCLLFDRPLGFAPPPRDGFALLASAHTDALGCKHIPSACYECTIRLYRSRVCVPQHKNRANFIELRIGEVRRKAPSPTLGE